MESVTTNHTANSSLQDLLQLASRRKRGMFFIFAGTVLLVTVWTFIQSPVYEIKSKVMVKYGREYIYRPVDLLQQGDVQPMLSFNREEIINTELQIFKSSELISEVIKSVGMDKLYPKIYDDKRSDQEKLSLAVARFKKDLDVIHVKGSGVIQVTFSHKDPETAVQAVSCLEDLFRNRHLKIFKSPKITFLEEQLQTYKNKLLKSQADLEAFKLKNHIISLKDQKQLLLQEYSRIQALLVQGKGRVRQLEQKIAALKKRSTYVPVDVVIFKEKAESNNIDTAKASLLALQLEERDLLQRYPENNRLVKNVRAKIHTVQNFLDTQAQNRTVNNRRGKNNVHQYLERLLIEAEADKKGQEAENEVLEKQLTEIENQLKGFSKKEAVLNMLKENVEINEKSYKNFIGRLEETRILEAMDNQKMVSIAVIEKPFLPVKPVRPKKGLNILIGVILGSALSLSYALFYDYLFVSKKGTS